MTAIVKHYLPEQQLDLPTLKLAVQKLEGQQSSEQSDRAPSISDDAPLNYMPNDDDGYNVMNADAGAYAAVTNQAASQQITVAREDCYVGEIAALHEQLGCLLLNAQGRYRETLLYIFERCSRCLTSWCRIYGSRFRNQLQCRSEGS